MKQVYKNKYIKVYECIKIVLGKNYSLICDIQRQSYRRLPSQIAEKIIKIDGALLNDNMLSDDSNFVQLLENEDIIFFTDRIDLFPKLDLSWEEPPVITHGILDVSKTNLHLFEIMIFNFNQINCEHLQVRIWEQINFEELDFICKTINNSDLISFELYLHGFNWDFNELNYFTQKFRKIVKLVITGCDKYDAIENNLGPNALIYRTSELVKSCLNCGNINSSLFVLNFKSFAEALHHNSCLNRKISIDTDGNIKNCPSMSESFGNILDISLAETIEKPGFNKYWNVNKDLIAVCKDCEFRYICTDCRAYVEDPHDSSGPSGTNLSKPLKCGYDPYTGEWAEWSSNPLKQKAIDFYGMREIVGGKDI